ncbi:hypothetical protein [Parasedimentitalea marina]|nr:hypothetical protein [Parasedimentitalea marina]
MITHEEKLAIATSPLNFRELRSVIDNETAETQQETTDLRILLAADLICDAALEVSALNPDIPNISKVVELDSNTSLDLAKTAVCICLQKAFVEGKVTQDELDALLLKGSVAGAIFKALEDGTKPEDLAGASIRIVPVRFSGFVKVQQKPKGFLKRLFGGS